MHIKIEIFFHFPFVDETSVLFTNLQSELYHINQIAYASKNPKVYSTPHLVKCQ